MIISAENEKTSILVMDIGGTYFRYALYSLTENKLSSVAKEYIPNFVNTTNSPINELQRKLIKKIIQRNYD